MRLQDKRLRLVGLERSECLRGPADALGRRELLLDAAGVGVVDRVEVDVVACDQS